jgi:hypothetical protein
MSKMNSSPCYVMEANKIDFDFDFVGDMREYQSVVFARVLV